MILNLKMCLKHHHVVRNSKASKQNAIAPISMGVILMALKEGNSLCIQIVGWVLRYLREKYYLWKGENKKLEV